MGEKVEGQKMSTIRLRATGIAAEKQNNGVHFFSETQNINHHYPELIFFLATRLECTRVNKMPQLQVQQPVNTSIVNLEI